MTDPSLAVLTGPVPDRGYGSLDAWLGALESLPGGGSAERALRAGLHADRLGYAFVGGYFAALARLVDQGAQLVPPLPRRVSFAVTENGGGHPKAIETRLEESDGHVTLTGEKAFATLAGVADELLVVATRGKDAAGRNQLAVVRVPTKAPGVRITPREPTPFAPEVPHARVVLDGVRVPASAVLPGDGYDRWVKPFRTVEDVHVLGATLAYLVRVARTHGFAPALVAELIAHAALVPTLAAAHPSSPEVHVALAGLFAGARRTIDALRPEWPKAALEAREHFERDRPLLQVAEQARAARFEAAWKALA